MVVLGRAHRLRVVEGHRLG
ncbi:uncharacterized protein G2W53_036692 [Senna tora]|uniref:Uncharacterized protein n=1 Tax=Senna tora TaxID=362788 RepID=A0A834STZ2_9FABA|nr:uncharacterized protein G2W53_036692 [Senna tora]